MYARPGRSGGRTGDQTGWKPEGDDEFAFAPVNYRFRAPIGRSRGFSFIQSLFLMYD
jgi:hypothetical protein